MAHLQSELAAEARAFGRYIVGRDAGERAASLYVRFAGALEGGASPDDANVVRFAANHPWSLAFLDGALAVVRPDALLRRKLLFLAAILEVQPELCDAFLPAPRPAWYGLAVAWSLVRAAFCAAAGLLLLPLAR